MGKPLHGATRYLHSGVSPTLKHAKFGCFDGLALRYLITIRWMLDTRAILVLVKRIHTRRRRNSWLADRVNLVGV